MNKLVFEGGCYKWYLSSTEYDSTDAWGRGFYYRQGDGIYKSHSYWVRAIRKVKKWTSSISKKRNIRGTGRVLSTVLRARGIRASTMATRATTSRLVVSGRERWEGWRFLSKNPEPDLQNGSEILSRAACLAYFVIKKSSWQRTFLNSEQPTLCVF